MRIIKFRAFHLEAEKFYEDGFSISQDGKYFYTDDEQEILINGNLKIDLFTGLKDKNGKEIYEGDIVTNGILKGNIKFGEYEHHFKGQSSPAIGYYLDGDNGFFLSENLENLEIIGNINENHELLT